MSVSFHVVGTVLGHYRLGRRIGRGGMGEVYEAEDLRLDRRVALKILSPNLHARPESLHRFVQEAKSASALNHPHILSVYDIGEGVVAGQPVHYIAMELVDGTTLRDEIHWKQVPLKRLINTLAQAADALAKAHARGIVHRDLKPENIMVTGDGYAKVIDFGLAKLIEPRISIRSHDTDRMTLTKEGHFLGTVGYMAPEQVDQKPADFRSDIFSFGCILYEAVTRTRAFGGPSDVEILYKILHEPPPLEKLDSLGSPELKRLIARCLEKSPDDRIQSMKDVAFELRAIELRLSGNEAVPPQPKAEPVRVELASTKVWWIAIAGLVIAAIPVLVTMRTPAPRKDAPQMHQLVDWPSNEGECQIAPNGTWVSFISDRDGKSAIWVRQLKGGPVMMLVDRPPDISSHVWSPDSNQIAYLSRLDGVFLQFVPAAGGPPSRSIDLGHEFKEDARLVRWIGPNIYLENRGVLWRMDTTTQKPVKVASPKLEGRVRQFSVRKDEKRIAFTHHLKNQVTIWTADIDGQNAVALPKPEPHNDYVPIFAGPNEGELVFSSNRTGPVDVWRLSLESASAPAQVTFSPGVEWVEDVSPDGRTIAAKEERKQAHLTLWERTFGQTTPVSTELVRDLWPSASAAGNVIAFQRGKPLERVSPFLLDATIMLAELKRGRLMEPRPTVGDAGLPLLSPDGRWLAYVKPLDVRQFEMWIKDLRTEHATRIAERVRPAGQYIFPVDWMHRNFAWSSSNTLYFVELVDAERFVIRSFVPATGETRRIVLANAGEKLYDLNLSADGRHLVYVREANGHAVIMHDLLTGHETVLWSPSDDRRQRVFAKGWRTTGQFVVVHSILDAEVNERVEAIQIDSAGAQTSIPIAGRGLGGSARLDRTSDSLLVVTIDADQIHQLEAVSLLNGRRRRITNNNLPGISFSGLEILPNKNIIFSTQTSNSDLWLIGSEK
jgi:serine/threonine protein kinase/Tol biopolymer transport system component